MGILFAFIAFFSWGIGDFLIQRSIRKFGNLVALVYITGFSAVVLLPFVQYEIAALQFYSSEFFLLILTSILLFVAALFNFEALRIGKAAVVVPVFAFEMLVTIFCSAFFLREYLTGMEAFLIGALFVGIVLVGTESFDYFKRIHLERGVGYALLGSIAMGAMNVLFGSASRETSPLLVNWFTSIVVVGITLVFLAFRSRLGELWKDWRINMRLIASVVVMDNLAWITYAYSMVLIPIAIATGISESYIALTAMLGLIFNKEKLLTHQWMGLVLCIVSAVVLATVTN